jgi:hypothetical protein
MKDVEFEYLTAKAIFTLVPAPSNLRFYWRDQSWVGASVISTPKTFAIKCPDCAAPVEVTEEQVAEYKIKLSCGCTFRHSIERVRERVKAVAARK